jgi:cytochrome d ubiquinol oxidase subunit II
MAVAFMIAVYVLLDGFDLGAGAIHLVAAKNDRERRTILKSIGPVWDGNEVWIIAAGGTLFFAFPLLYAASFSGFYLPLMIVLWLLIIRGLSIELRAHINDPMWASFWDGMFFLELRAIGVSSARLRQRRARRLFETRTTTFFLPAVDELSPFSVRPAIWTGTRSHGFIALVASWVHGATTSP